MAAILCLKSECLLYRYIHNPIHEFIKIDTKRRKSDDDLNGLRKPPMLARYLPSSPCLRMPPPNADCV